MSLSKAVRRLVRHFGYDLVAVQASLPKGIRKDYDVILDRLGRYSFKFLDVKTFLPITLHRAYALGLHDASPKDILDIGTGTGYFPVICEHYGHSVMAIDRDGNQVFNDVTKWLNVNRTTWEIEPFERIPSMRKRFDLVTAFMVNFDRHKGREYAPWGIAEWRFFLADLAENHLKPQGSVFLELNEHTRAQQDVMAFFDKSGAKCLGGRILFSSFDTFRSREAETADWQPNNNIASTKDAF